MLSKKAETRLSKLIEYIDSLPRTAAKHFSMKQWLEHKGKGHDHGLEGVETFSKKHIHSCGTTACVLGWATTDYRFRAMGLRLQAYKADVGRAGLSAAGEPGWNVWEGVGSIFDISEDQCTQLFGPENNDASPKAWVKRARKAVSAWKQSP